MKNTGNFKQQLNKNNMKEIKLRLKVLQMLAVCILALQSEADTIPCIILAVVTFFCMEIYFQWHKNKKQ